ncbi:GreA/GreB family elongation factor [Luteolibacter pohnpeiensis]|uniref:GreA/GreB family elongation factor n=1 Tax=Luteolibacter pohnpeiensis TaxID=454153 RepID=A0A934S8S8_9BACT|nr:GreA/GreB family elongation factor [Luteolibacter pohnpeiensis]MBK1884252.1 GreA/GreB family elongation factor [Luteolibacter pohnpeiensis]
MHPDVAKLVEAGRIPKPVGERLSQLAPGNFCLHKSFGAGKVVEWDLPSKKVTIDFEKSPGQTMELQFAFQRTEWIPADDFRAKKIEQREELHVASQNDPVGMVVHLLESHGGSMTVDALEKELSGTVIPEKSFKKWWDTTKKALRESRRVVVPAKRTEALVLRSTDVSPADSLIADFEASKDIKGMIRALEAIAADIGAFEADSTPLKNLLNDIDEGAKKAARVQLGQALQLVAARDEVIGSSKALELDPTAVRLSDLVLTADAEKLAEDIGTLPSGRQRAIFEAFPTAFGEEWVEKMVLVFDRVGARGVTEIARILADRTELEALENHLRSALARRALGPDALIWVCRERRSTASEVFGADVGASILNLLENDHLSDGPRKTSRLQTLLNDDKTLLVDLVEIMDVNESRNFARRLLDCPVFGDLEKKSLMARIIKARPETAELVSGESGRKKEEALVVSWESLERKKAELDDMIRVRIPQNTKDISIARSYGDLRENFEYKSAKDLQKVLMRRKGELERDIGRARGTDFKGSDASSINIGTIVTLVDESGQEVEMTVLGAWDSFPDKKIVSYLSEVGKSLVGRVPGDAVRVRDTTTEAMQTLTIRSIRPYNP